MNKEFKFSKPTRVAGFGHCIVFEPGVPRAVPPILQKLVMSRGGVPVDGEPVDLDGGDPSPAEPMTIDQRREKIREAVAGLLAENNSEHFGANGRPRVAPVSELTGFKVDIKEINEAWEALRDAADDA